MKKQKNNKKLKMIIAPLIVLAIIVVLLEMVVKLGNIDETILPSPSSIFNAWINNFYPALWPYFIETLLVMIIGYVIGVPIGVTIAGLLSQFTFLRKTFSPYIIMLCTTPLITLIPLFKLWLGFGTYVKVLIVIIQVIPIIALNSISGFSNISSSKLELMEAYGAKKGETFFKVIFPHALPQVFAGAKLGCIFATIATISCEFTGFKGGLGTRIVYYSKFLNTDIVFSVIIMISLIGIAMFSLVTFIESKIVIWKAD